ncbi:unnamed protein product [Caenorhabditis brenneri]
MPSRQQVIRQKFDALLTNNNLNTDNYEIPTVKQIDTWKKKPMSALGDPLFATTFQEYLFGAQNYHDLDLYREMLAFKKNRSPDDRSRAGKHIVNMYLRNRAPLQVQVEQEIIDNINKKIDQRKPPPPRTFDKAIEKMKERLMHQHTIYITSPFFVELEGIHKH